MRTSSYWHDRGWPGWRPDPDRDHSIMPTSVEVLVVGGGITGLCTAALLHEAGVEVAVVEALTVAARTTGHTTAKVTALHGTIYQRLRSGRGADVAAAYAGANRAAVADLVDLVGRWDLDCELTAAPAVTCAVTEHGAAMVHAEADAAAEAGLPVRLVTSTDLPVELTAAVALDDGVHLDPVRFARSLAAALRTAGVPVVEGRRVVGDEERPGGCEVHLNDETTVAANQVVHATHLPISDPALLAGRVTPLRSYLVAGPRDGAGDGAGDVPTGMFLAADAGWSVRPVAGDPPMVLVGGEGHPMTDDLTSEDRYGRLEALARSTFGVDVSHRWSAFDYESVDGVPFIGRLSPRSSRRFVATGFGKWGMSNGMVAATIIARAIAPDGSGAHPHESVFDATRFVSTIGRDIVRHNTKVALRFVLDRAAAVVQRDGEPEPGCGVVVSRDGRPVGISCDLDGTVRTVSATCTHLGCVVGFNDGDRTWDCPCHGSRFDLDGSVLDGPATDPLRLLTISLPD